MPRSPGRNYLRARGEYHFLVQLDNPIAELPPRTRRIPQIGLPWVVDLGTTSAHAENTNLEKEGDHGRMNYLRARGEYSKAISVALRTAELPPRARRIQKWFDKHPDVPGTTSACAENTLNELGLL